MVVALHQQAMATAGLNYHLCLHPNSHWTNATLIRQSSRPHASPFLQMPRRPRFHRTRAESNDTESKEVLDAFFLGKAFAEALTERLGTVVGELLSDVGRWQAEQQKQVRNFQEEVQERAKKAKAKAITESRSDEQKAFKNVSQNGASSPADRDDKVQTVKPLKKF